MSRLDAVLQQAVATKAAPFLVAMTANSDGVLWKGAAGEARPGVPAGEDTLFAYWSMTKAIGSLATLVLVDRGQLSLDTPVGDVLPRFDDLQVLEGIVDDRARMRRPRSRATLRHLLTHTSGLAYPMFNAAMIEYGQVTEMSYVMKGDISELEFPLMFDPGTAFSYGIGVDWAGLLIQELSGKSVDVFCRDEVLAPLGMNSVVFEPEHSQAPLATAHRREDDHFTPMEFRPPPHPELYGFGNAMFGTADDYLRFLRFVLRGGELDGTRLLRPETFEFLVSNQAGNAAVPMPRSLDQALSRDADVCFTPSRMSHTAAFFRTEDDIPGMRSAGSLWWSGFLNTHYWVDPKRDIAAVFMTQTLPFCDDGLMPALREFEQAVYQDRP